MGITDLPGPDGGPTEGGFESGSEASADAPIDGSTGRESGADGSVEGGALDASDAQVTDASPDVNSGCPLAGAAAGTVVEYSIPPINGVAGNQSQPDGIARGPDGNLWFTESAAHAVGWITPGGRITQLSTAADPLGIVPGPQGGLWFVAVSGSLGYVDLSGPGTPVPVTIPIPNGGNGSPRRIAVGPDGNLWFTLFGTDMIGTYNPADGGFVEYPVPTANAEPDGITAGPPGDGNLWFTEEGGNKIGAMATDGTVREYPIPTAGAKAQGITVGPDGALWFAEETPSLIGRITTNGAVVEYPVGNGSGPVHVASDGKAVWFTQTGANEIGRIALDGGVTEYQPPTTGATPADIAIGPCGSIWFPEYNTGNIGVLTP